MLSFRFIFDILTWEIVLQLPSRLQKQILRPASEMVHNEKQHEKNQNVKEVIEEDNKNQTNDAARNVSTHGRRKEPHLKLCVIQQIRDKWREREKVRQDDEGGVRVKRHRDRRGREI